MNFTNLQLHYAKLGKTLLILEAQVPKLAMPRNSFLPVLFISLLFAVTCQKTGRKD